jgi:hypothetical protein
VASIILKWKKFGTTNTLFGHPAKLSNRGRRALVREVTKNVMVTQTELYSSSVEKGEPSRRATISAELHQIRPLWWPDISHSSVKKRHMAAHLEFSKRHPKTSDHEKQDSLV